MRTVDDILNQKGRDVATVSRGAAVIEAAQMMNERRIGAVVVSDGDKLVGIFTERDVLNRVVAAERDPRRTLVGDVMTTPMACCTGKTTIDECSRVMREKRIRHIPVVEDGRLRGMISIGDLNATQVVEQEETIHYLNEYLYGRS